MLMYQFKTLMSHMDSVDPSRRRSFIHAKAIVAAEKDLTASENYRSQTLAHFCQTWPELQACARYVRAAQLAQFAGTSWLTGVTSLHLASVWDSKTLEAVLLHHLEPGSVDHALENQLHMEVRNKDFSVILALQNGTIAVALRPTCEDYVACSWYPPDRPNFGTHPYPRDKTQIKLQLGLLTEPMGYVWMSLFDPMSEAVMMVADQYLQDGYSPWVGLKNWAAQRLRPNE
jgi:hypothetical protein